LLYGVPLLIFPGPIFERRFNASKVQDVGAGRMGELTDFNEAWIQPILVKRNEYAKHAKQISKKIESLGGARQAVQAIQTAFTHGIAPV
jgi:UDP:flavonoid glycosyltransferase YjiC (YdhE family)